MAYQERAKKWYERALEEKDEFVKFLLFYISLEVCVKLRFNRIRDVKNDNSIKKNFYNRIDHEYLDKLKHVLDENPLQNLKSDVDPSWSGRLKSVADFGGIIEFIITARNNLFHGDKGLDESRDVFIVKEGNKILQPLVEAIIL